MTVTGPPQRPPSVAAEDVAAEVAATGIVAVLRAPSAGHIERAAETLVAAGITCVEVALTTPGGLEAIRTLRRRLEGAWVGAGTVTSRQQLEAALDCGAQFVVSPGVGTDVIGACVEAGVACYPGALTPTEVLAAWQAGATAVKLFPASLGGPSYLRALKDPLPEVAILPTGGVALAAIGDYLAAGAVAVGLGSPLLGDALSAGDVDGLRGRAEQALEAVRAARDRR
jgi:2-dehydro-3-deoxyphosphogluconate aldolase/(4S)-4-hydroxy-2-oxoglutarate aldolase